MTQQENDELMYSSPEDNAFYHRCVEGLPTLAGLNGTGKDADGVPLPYGCGPHSVRCLREIVDIVKPKTMLCIGTNMGWSDAMWLELSETVVYSCDVSRKQETLKAVDILQNRYPNRFFYFNRLDEIGNTYYLPRFYDLIFIDGSHLFDDVVIDIKLAIDLRIPYIAMDDWLADFGDAQLAANEFIGTYLEVINVNGNIALLKNKTL